MRTTDHFTLPDPPPWDAPHACVGLRHSASTPGAHPCADCIAACCWALSVRKEQMVTKADFDHLEAHLAYEGMTAWIDTTGKYSIGLITACRHLDRDQAACTIHDDKPHVCSDYEGANCWYRRIISRTPPTLGIFDYANFQVFKESVRFADGGLIMGLPSREELPPPRPPEEYTVATEITVGFLPDEYNPDPLFGHYLVFLSNFPPVQLIRTPTQWAMMLRLNRIAQPRMMLDEVQDGVVGGVSRVDQVRPEWTQVQRLFEQFGPTFHDLSPDRLREELARSVADSPASY